MSNSINMKKVIENRLEVEDNLLNEMGFDYYKVVNFDSEFVKKLIMVMYEDMKLMLGVDKRKDKTFGKIVCNMIMSLRENGRQVHYTRDNNDYGKRVNGQYKQGRMLGIRRDDMIDVLNNLEKFGYVRLFDEKYYEGKWYESRFIPRVKFLNMCLELNSDGEKVYDVVVEDKEEIEHRMKIFYEHQKVAKFNKEKNYEWYQGKLREEVPNFVLTEKLIKEEFRLKYLNDEYKKHLYEWDMPSEVKEEVYRRYKIIVPEVFCPCVNQVYNDIRKVDEVVVDAKGKKKKNNNRNRKGELKKGLGVPEDEVLSRNGRRYNGWINLKKVYRKYMRIDKEKVVDVDYGSLHLSLLYGLSKNKPKFRKGEKQDLYELNWDEESKELFEEETGLKLRGVIKGIVNRMINCKLRITKNNSMEWFYSDVCVKFKKVPLSVEWDKENNKIETFMTSLQLVELKKYLPEIVKGILSKHKDVKHLFFNRGIYESGKGVSRDLQNYDQKIGYNVQMRMFSMGIATFGLHDGFLVSKSNGKLLKQVMIEEFDKELKGCRFEIKVKIQDDEIDYDISGDVDIDDEWVEKVEVSNEVETQHSLYF